MAVLFSPPADPFAEHRGVIVKLSEELHVSLHEVTEIYQQQLDRLTAGARIQNFLPVLATRCTRSILRAANRRSAPLYRA